MIRTTFTTNQEEQIIFETETLDEAKIRFVNYLEQEGYIGIRTIEK
jgi:hypothetical protein